MAYIINNYNSSQLTVVEDGTIDQTTDLKLVGKNYAGYGEIQNENFVFLLENFAGANQPPKAVPGQVWFDSGSSKLKFYDGFRWRTTGGAEIGNTVPAGLSEGDFWWDSDREQLYAYNGASFVLIGPQGIGDGITRFVSEQVIDTVGGSRSVITARVRDEAILMISGDEFIIDETYPGQAGNYAGFDVIRQGVTLINTQDNQLGITNSAHEFHGTASNASRLGGVPKDEFVLKDLAKFDGLVEFSDLGLTIGESSDFEFKIINYDKGLIANTTGSEIYIQVQGSGTQGMPVRFQSDKMLPGYADVVSLTGKASVSLGDANYTFHEMHADTFIGIATKSNTLLLNGDYVAATTSAAANRIVGRDNSSNIYANYFIGTATKAQYADLAENYLADADYEPGTVLIFGGDNEVTISLVSDDARIAGVVSTKPAYLMNDSLNNGTPIALKGRVPCAVVGPVKKGDILISSDTPGAAKAVPAGILPHSLCIVGRSLENNAEEKVKYVEIFVG